MLKLYSYAFCNQQMTVTTLLIVIYWHKFLQHIEGHADGIDAQVVKEAVLQAIKNVQDSEQ